MVSPPKKSFLCLSSILFRIVCGHSLVRMNALSVESGHFILYPTLLGIKVVNLVTNKVARVIGRQETAERFLGIALYQGRTVGSAALGTLQLNAAPDPTLFACAWKRHRFYLFTTRLPSKDSEEGTGRDVFNEKPTKDELALNVAGSLSHLAFVHHSVIQHTTVCELLSRARDLLIGFLARKEKIVAVSAFCNHSYYPWRYSH